MKGTNLKSLVIDDADDVEFYDKLEKKQKDRYLAKATEGNVCKENLHDYIGKKREMFLVQYALGVKRQVALL